MHHMNDNLDILRRTPEQHDKRSKLGFSPPGLEHGGINRKKDVNDMI